jgi:6-pyruvoyltetrahydropterin/6-carboxytetrahydropterin synthase
MYRLSIACDFIAQHYLVGGDWGAENVRHSHAYKVEVMLRGAALDPHGYLVDIVGLQSALDEVIAQFRDRTLNELEPFAGLNPSLERFAKVIHDQLHAKVDLRDLFLAVKVWENERAWAAYGRE